MSCNYPERNELLRLIASLKFRKFKKKDWLDFAVDPDSDPLIAEYGDGYAVIIEGQNVIITHEEDKYGAAIYAAMYVQQQ